MCGICGLAALDGGGVDRAALEAMNAALVHRGPDEAGIHVEGPVGLANRRLAIIDLPDGRQPMPNEDRRVWLVQNGEIYNHAALRADLAGRGHRFSTDHSDTEVLVHLYEERGAEMLTALRGMFALAVWDARDGRLLLARDRFGIKPLFWRAEGGVLSFASELKALLRQPGVSRDLDLAALDAYLAFNSIPAPRSIFREVHKLPAGHALEWDGSDIRVWRWARPAPAARSAVRGERFDDLAGELRERLRDSVRAHLVADVPVGVFLSGGVDSAALAALAAQETAGRVATFSIGFEEQAFNEVDRARLVAERYGTDHHELVLRPDAVDLLPRLVDAFDEPFGDSSALPTWMVSQLAARHVKVALSGEGGDELFGGYFTYVADLLAPWLRGPAALARPLVERLPSTEGRVPLDYKARRFVRAAGLPPLERHHGWKEILAPAVRAELLAPAGGPPRPDPVDVLRARFAETEGAPLLARLQDVDLGVYLVDDLLVKTDRMSMAHSLEARVPFLDPVVAELALAVPTAAKVRGLQKKRLLRRAVEPLLPREIVHGPKRGFSIPAPAWLRGELEPFAREVLAPTRLRDAGLFDPAVVTRLLDEHVARREDHSRALWGLLCFELWRERHAGA